eukprot:3484039-Rhodomonas_salina.1
MRPDTATEGNEAGQGEAADCKKARPNSPVAALPADGLSLADTNSQSVVASDRLAPRAALEGASSGLGPGQLVQNEALQFVTGQQTTQSFEILPGLRRDQYLAPVILLQMDALLIRHRHRNGKEKLDQMLTLFIARLKHLSGILANASADDQYEFDVEAQLLCAERWVRSVVQGERDREV